MNENVITVDVQKMQTSPEYYQKKMVELGRREMMYGDVVWECINVNNKITNWRQVIENDR